MMNRSIDDRTVLDSFAEEFCKIIEKYAKYIVVSGYVAISLGRTRGTEDIDLIMERVNEEKFTEVHNDLVKNGFICIQDDNPKEIFEYLDEKMSVRYVKKGSIVPEMEVKFAKDALDSYQLQNRIKIPLSGVDIFFSSIEANIAFKEELLKSEKDFEDAKHLRIIFKGKLNEQEIAHYKKMIKELR